MKAATSIVSVTSFNEWGEGTQVKSLKYFQRLFSFQVEPAVPYGLTNISYNDYSPLPPDYYLKATAKWALELADSNNS